MGIKYFYSSNISRMISIGKAENISTGFVEHHNRIVPWKYPGHFKYNSNQSKFHGYLWFCVSNNTEINMIVCFFFSSSLKFSFATKI